MTSSTADAALLATNEEIRRFAELAEARGRFAIDTEFVGEGKYQSLLCLVQVAVRGAAGQPDRVAGGVCAQPRY